MPRTIALLRGVNVGGARKIAMADLRAFAEELGFESPRTLLQSGNLVFDAPDQPTDKLEATLEREAAARLGLETAFLLRTAEEWREILAEPLFPEAAAKTPAKLILFFLKHAPSPAQIEAARAAIKGPEQIAAADRRVAILYPDGQGRSKLTTAALEKALGGLGTGRNWNTATKLGALLDA